MLSQKQRRTIANVRDSSVSTGQEVSGSDAWPPKICPSDKMVRVHDSSCKIEKSRYLSRGSSDFDEIWNSDAVRPYLNFSCWMMVFWHFLCCASFRCSSSPSELAFHALMSFASFCFSFAKSSIFSSANPTKNVTPRAIILTLNMHQILCRLGLRPRPHWGSL